MVALRGSSRTSSPRVPAEEPPKHRRVISGGRPQREPAARTGKASDDLTKFSLAERLQPQHQCRCLPHEVVNRTEAGTVRTPPQGRIHLLQFVVPKIPDDSRKFGNAQFEHRDGAIVLVRMVPEGWRLPVAPEQRLQRFHPPGPSPAGTGQSDIMPVNRPKPRERGARRRLDRDRDPGHGLEVRQGCAKGLPETWSQFLDLQITVTSFRHPWPLRQGVSRSNEDSRPAGRVQVRFRNSQEGHPSREIRRFDGRRSGRRTGSIPCAPNRSDLRTRCRKSRSRQTS